YCLPGTVPFDLSQLLGRATAQLRKRFVLVEQLTSDIHPVLAALTGARQYRDQFGVAEGVRPSCKQLFSRPVGLRHFADLKLRHNIRISGGAIDIPNESGHQSPSPDFSRREVDRTCRTTHHRARTTLRCNDSAPYRRMRIALCGSDHCPPRLTRLTRRWSRRSL